MREFPEQPVCESAIKNVPSFVPSVTGKVQDHHKENRDKSVINDAQIESGYCIVYEFRLNAVDLQQRR